MYEWSIVVLCKHHVCYYRCSDVNKYLFYSFFALFLLKLESFGSFSSSLFSDAFLFIFFMLLLAFWPLESHSAIRFLDFSSALLSFAVSKSIGSTLFGKLWLLFLTFPTSRDTGCHAIWKRIFKKTYKNKFFFSVNQSFGVLLDGPISGIVFHMRCPEPYRTKLPQKRREQVTNLY